jgi:glutathione S-transferase
MSLTLYFHPLASFAQKALIALYENGTAFTPHLVDLGDADAAARFRAIWPIGKMPVLRDEGRDETIPESSVVIEYLDQHYPGRTRFIPADPARALQTRLRDRFYDLYVQEPMQKIVTDRIRPPQRNDPHGVEQARMMLATAYDVLERQLSSSTWAAGEEFTLADCAAAPALFYAGKVLPYAASHPSLARYFARLVERPSYARVLEEATPWMANFPPE